MAPAYIPGATTAPVPTIEQQWAGLKQRLDLAPTSEIAASLEAMYVFFCDSANRAAIGRQPVLDALHSRKSREKDWSPEAASATSRLLQKLQQ